MRMQLSITTIIQLLSIYHRSTTISEFGAFSTTLDPMIIHWFTLPIIKMVVLKSGRK